jgi:hypothetical protein
MKSDRDLDIAVEGFYGAGDPVTPEDDALIDRLVQRLDPQVILKEIGAVRFKQDNLRIPFVHTCFSPNSMCPESRPDM